MTKVRHRKLTRADLLPGFEKVAAQLSYLEMEVKPFGCEYVAIQEMKANMNVLAACAMRDLFFKPTKGP